MNELNAIAFPCESRSVERLKGRQAVEKLCKLLFFCVAFGTVLLLIFFLATIFAQGWHYLDWQFLSSYASQNAERAGIKAAVFGTVWTTILTVLISVPIGLGTAIYLEEYARPGRLNQLLEICISNLAGVPSIVFGLLGLALFVRQFCLGRSIIAASLTLSLLVLPGIIVVCREALRSVPNPLRQAAYALSATKLEAIRDQILPAAVPGIMTAFIFSTSRSIGECAPLLMTGALAYIAFIPASPLSKFTVLPVQIFAWSSRPQAEFNGLAAAGIIVLLCILVCVNAIAVVLREKHSKGARNAKC